VERSLVLGADDGALCSAGTSPVQAVPGVDAETHATKHDGALADRRTFV
jgi:hypothetical protein